MGLLVRTNCHIDSLFSSFLKVSGLVDQISEGDFPRVIAWVRLFVMR
jgi:hypothetical protein